MENQGSKRGKTMFAFFKPNKQTSTSKGYSPFNVDVSNRCKQPLSNLKELILTLILLNEILRYEF